MVLGSTSEPVADPGEAPGEPHPYLFLDQTVDTAPRYLRVWINASSPTPPPPPFLLKV